MSNVLPTKYSIAAWRVYRTRVVLAAAASMFIGACVALLSLLPGYIVLRIANANLQQATSATTTTTTSESSSLARTRSLVTVLTPLVASSSPSERMLQLIALRPQGITLQELSYTRGSPGTIILSGTAISSMAIDQYRNALRAAPDVLDATVPISDLAGAGDGAFTITVTGTF